MNISSEEISSTSWHWLVYLRGQNENQCNGDDDLTVQEVQDVHEIGAGRLRNKLPAKEKHWLEAQKSQGNNSPGQKGTERDIHKGGGNVVTRNQHKAILQKRFYLN